MGKISPVSIKYIIHARLELSGVAERPDIIGAVFGQTEGLLGSDLELRELQKSGRIGRIDVKLEIKSGKTSGEILLPSSMGKSETAIVGAALETIERVGPCDAKIKVTAIEDVRVSKRTLLLTRAKELLKDLVEKQPDSTVITSEVAQSVRALEITEYGKDRLPAGPAIDENDEIIIVEGRADVIHMLRYGIRNVVALGGAKASDTIIELLRKKVTTVFIDGDRGGELILKNLADVGELDYVARAPDGKEVEELSLKEINKALRAKISWDQFKAEGFKENGRKQYAERPKTGGPSKPVKSFDRRSDKRTYSRERKPAAKPELPKKEAKLIKQMAEELVGTRGAFILDESLSVLGKVPVKELQETLENLSDEVFAVILDGQVSKQLVKLAENKNVKFLISGSIAADSNKVTILAPKDL